MKIETSVAELKIVANFRGGDPYFSNNIFLAFVTLHTCFYRFNVFFGFLFDMLIFTIYCLIS